jgi:benzoate-CoA ligase
MNAPARFNLAEWLLDGAARAHADRMAIAGSGRAVSYGELAEMVNRAGNALQGLGCGAGDRVLLILPDSAEFIAAFLGAAKIGAIAVPVNPLSRAADLAYYAGDCGAAAAVVHAVALPEFVQAKALPDEKVLVCGGDGAAEDGLRRWEECLAAASSDLTAADTRESDAAFFLYTSGSTGGPKAAVHAHKDMRVTTGAFARNILGITPQDRTLSVSKLFFAYGLGNGLYFPLAAGASTVLLPERPRAEVVLDAVARYRPTLFFSVPTFYAGLLRAAETQPADFSAVRLAVSAGEALPVEIFEKFKQRFGLEIVDAIGSTEMLHMFISSVPGRIRPGSCGVPLEGYGAQIVDEKDQPVAEGVVGNLWVRGGSAFAEYWQQPEKTAAARRGDWVVTGDKFYRDTEGYYFYCGRADDMMKVSGMWVAPGEVENALLAHPAVAEAAAAGLNQGGLTQLTTWVVLRDGEAGGEELAEELRQFVRSKLVAYKCPEQVRFVAELPKTATGKIQRFKLREQG